MDKPNISLIERGTPPYPLGQFPEGTVLRLAGEIVYLLYRSGEARLPGLNWEQIFARVIGAEWSPSVEGLDDIWTGSSCCWRAKTVKDTKPLKAKRVKLVTGPKSGDYTYYHNDFGGLEPAELGKLVLGIWNQKVSSVRQQFAHYRTVVLVRSNNLLECALFELETLCYDTDQYIWKWNANKNLEGHDEYGQHRFTWQPHGAQFTIVEDMPPERLAFQLRAPESLPRETALKALNFDETWLTLL